MRAGALEAKQEFDFHSFQLEELSKAKLEEGEEERLEQELQMLENAEDELANYKQRVKNLSPSTILNKGFAIVTINNQIVTDPKKITANAALQTILKNEIIHSTVTKKSKNENQFDI